MNWFGRLWHRDRLERELDAELRFHVDEETRRLGTLGMAPDEARRVALAAFGGIEPIKEAARDARGTRWLEDLAADLRYAARTMRRQPAFALAAILSLAIGIGANTAIFTVLNALLIRPLPVPRPQELSYLSRTRPVGEGRSAEVTRFSYPQMQRLAAELARARTAVAGMTRTTRMQAAIGESDAEFALTQLVTGRYFEVLGARAQVGRLLTPADDGSDGQAAAVLSDAYWTRRFAGDPSVVGSTIRLNGFPLTVVGVAEAGFSGFIVGEPSEVWTPAALQPQLHYAFNADIVNSDATKPWVPQDGISWLAIVTRTLRPATVSQASAIATTLCRTEAAARAAAITDPRQRAYALAERVRLVSGARGMSDVRNRFGRAILVLMVTVALVLLVACANLANLLMARSSARAREFAVRLSLGAGRGRLARQLLTEALMLSLLAGVASLFLARLGSQALLAMSSGGPSPVPLDISIRWPVVAFAGALAVLTGLLFGSAPALRFSRPDIYEAIRSTSGVVGLRRQRLPLGRLLVVGQVAVSLMLLVAAALFVRTLHNLLEVDAGFEASHLVTTKFDPRMAGYTGQTLPALRDRLLTGAHRMPGAQEAAVAMCGTMAGCLSVSSIEVPGRTQGVGDDGDVQEDYVNGEYFAALGMRLLAGRTFAASDDEHAVKVAVVNETMARHFFGDASPIGRRFTKDGDYEVIGLVRDSRVNGLREAPPRMVYYPYSQHADIPVRNLYVRVVGDVKPALANVRAVVREADRAIAVREVVTLAELKGRTVVAERTVSSLTAVFGLLAAAVACLGLYGMVSYSVARRTNEIGIRVALGATRTHVRWLVLRETLALVGAGVVLGFALAWPALRFVEGLLYGIAARDPVTLGGAAALLALSALAASYFPARRALSINPVVALRSE